MLETLIAAFETIEDPRCEWKVEHRLLDILVIAVCAVLGEAESFEDIALYGRCKRQWLEGFLALPNGIPSHDTFRRVLMLVDPDSFERSFLDWVRAVFRPEEGGPRQVAIDGKTVRRSFDREKGRSPLHLVSAYATEGGIVLAQRATETKGGELAVLPDLLDGLDLAGCLVSLDALACQPGIAERVVGRGGDYLLALKGNRRKAHAEVKAWFATNAFALGAPLRPCFDAFDDGHGRLVRRRPRPARAPAGVRLRRPRAVRRPRGLAGAGHGGRGRDHPRHPRPGQGRGRDPVLPVERAASPGTAGGGHPEPLEGRERAPLGARRRLPRGRQPGARAQRRQEPGAAAQDRAQPRPGRQHTEGQPEGQAQVRRLGRRLHGDPDRRLISCVTPAPGPTAR
jgi:hypothetical protein